jgi:hypothetical protein
LVINSRDNENSVGTDTEAAIAPPLHLVAGRLERATDQDKVVAQTLHLYELHPAS